MTGTPWPDDAPLFGSGRDALLALARWGAERHGWRRVRLPSFYCPEVPESLLALATEGLDVAVWPDDVLAATVSAATVRRLGLAPGDVLVVANQLGVRACPDPAALAAAVAAAGAILVEDHSHDPASTWADRSRAHYAFASLRKTLPLPDGGVLWSPRGLALPPGPDRAAGPVPGGGSTGSSAGARAGDDPLVGALRRREARHAAAAGTPPFRALARSGPCVAVPGAGDPISPTSRALLPTMPVAAWRARRDRNLRILAAGVGAARGVRVLASPPGGVAFACTLVFDDPADRELARAALVARAVAPTIIWPLDASMPGLGPADAALSRRLLSIPCDQRYGDEDMRRLAHVVREALDRSAVGPGRAGLPRPTGAG